VFRLTSFDFLSSVSQNAVQITAGDTAFSILVVREVPDFNPYSICLVK
jgi:hypothetical protein